jgi:hypothetical protein
MSVDAVSKLTSGAKRLPRRRELAPMKLDDLISRLSRDTSRPQPVSRAFLLALALGAVVSALLFTLALGLRPDAAEAFRMPQIAMKPVLGLLAGLGCIRPALTFARPGAAMRIGRSELPLALLPVAAALLFGLELQRLAAGERWSAFVGESLPVFLLAMPLLSLPFLAGAFIALRHGACTMPVLTGGIAGMLSGGFGVALYALFCTEDSALFFVPWYLAGIAAMAGAGAALGPAALRW